MIRLAYCLRARLRLLRERLAFGGASSLLRRRRCSGCWAKLPRSAWYLITSSMRALLVSAWRSRSCRAAFLSSAVRAVVVADGGGLLVGEVGGDSASEVGVVDGFAEDAAA